MRKDEEKKHQDEYGTNKALYSSTLNSTLISQQDDGLEVSNFRVDTPSSSRGTTPIELFKRKKIVIAGTYSPISITPRPPQQLNRSKSETLFIRRSIPPMVPSLNISMVGSNRCDNNDREFSFNVKSFTARSALNEPLFEEEDNLSVMTFRENEKKQQLLEVMSSIPLQLSAESDLKNIKTCSDSTSRAKTAPVRRRRIHRSDIVTFITNNYIKDSSETDTTQSNKQLETTLSVTDIESLLNPNLIYECTQMRETCTDLLRQSVSIADNNLDPNNTEELSNTLPDINSTTRVVNKHPYQIVKPVLYGRYTRGLPLDLQRKLLTKRIALEEKKKKKSARKLSTNYGLKSPREDSIVERNITTLSETPRYKAERQMIFLKHNREKSVQVLENKARLDEMEHWELHTKLDKKLLKIWELSNPVNSRYCSPKPYASCEFDVGEREKRWTVIALLVQFSSLLYEQLQLHRIDPAGEVGDVPCHIPCLEEPESEIMEIDIETMRSNKYFVRAIWKFKRKQIATKIIRDSLLNWIDLNHMVKLVKRFQYRIRLVQRVIRRHLAKRQSVLQLLVLQFEREEKLMVLESEKGKRRSKRSSATSPSANSKSRFQQALRKVAEMNQSVYRKRDESSDSIQSSIPRDIRDRILLEDYFQRKSVFIKRLIAEEREIQKKDPKARLSKRFKTLPNKSRMRKLITAAENEVRNRWLRNYEEQQQQKQLSEFQPPKLQQDKRRR